MISAKLGLKSSSSVIGHRTALPTVRWRDGRGAGFGRRLDDARRSLDEWTRPSIGLTEGDLSRFGAVADGSDGLSPSSVLLSFFPFLPLLTKVGESSSETVRGARIPFNRPPLPLDGTLSSERPRPSSIVPAAVRTAGEPGPCLMLIMRRLLESVPLPKLTSTPTARRFGASLLSAPLNEFGAFGQSRSEESACPTVSLSLSTSSVAVPLQSPLFSTSRSTAWTTGHQKGTS